MTSAIKIRNLARWTSGKVRWQVTCDTCKPDSFNDLFGVRSFVRTAQWSDALWWANWHRAEHQRTTCGCCGHIPPIDPITVLDGNAVRVGERLFLRDGTGWVQVATHGNTTIKGDS